jgi:hypothetical protein
MISVMFNATIGRLGGDGAGGGAQAVHFLSHSHSKAKPAGFGRLEGVEGPEREKRHEGATRIWVQESRAGVSYVASGGSSRGVWSYGSRSKRLLFRAVHVLGWDSNRRDDDGVDAELKEDAWARGFK